MKFYKFLITAACIAIAAVCIALIVRVNRAFPNAEEVSYTKDNPADLDGLEITPVNAKVYTLEDYSKISGQYKNVSEEKAKNVRIIVMTVRLRNTTDQVINYVPSFICVVEELNGSNGVQPVSNSMRRITLDPGQTQALLHALDKYKFDAAFGGARRDEEKSRAKERIFSFRDKFHQWDPKNQRPELWDIYNARVHKGESIRVFPLSNWTELDIWQYIRLENIPIVPLYFAKERPCVEIDGNLIMADDDRLPEQYREKIEMRMVRFRTLGCWPLTGAVESNADTIEKIVEEMMTTTKSERTTRVIDFDQEASMEQKKREGYF